MYSSLTIVLLCLCHSSTLHVNTILVCRVKLTFKHECIFKYFESVSLRTQLQRSCAGTKYKRVKKKIQKKKCLFWSSLFEISAYSCISQNGNILGKCWTHGCQSGFPNFFPLFFQFFCPVFFENYWTKIFTTFTPPFDERYPKSCKKNFKKKSADFGLLCGRSVLIHA